MHLGAGAPLEIASRLQRILRLIQQDKVPCFGLIKGQRTGTGTYVWPPAFVFPGDFAHGSDSANLQMMALNAVHTLFFAPAKKSVSDLLQREDQGLAVQAGMQQEARGRWDDCFKRFGDRFRVLKRSMERPNVSRKRACRNDAVPADDAGKEE